MKFGPGKWSERLTAGALGPTMVAEHHFGDYGIETATHVMTVAQE